MRMLAIEFSGPVRSAALLDNQALPGSGERVWQANESDLGRAGGLVLVEEVLRKARVAPAALDCLAIGLGPGSYTGIRAAISLAQGWQLANSVKLLGLSSVECLAAQAQAAQLAGRVHIAVDAQRGEFYLASYELSETGSRLLEPLRIVPGAEVARRHEAGERLIGPEVDRWFPGSRRMNPEAQMLARLALARTDYVSGETLEPIYLRETSFVVARPKPLKWMASGGES